MNANELADALVEMKGYYGYNEEAATMLRQQQAEIERLTTKNLEWLANWNEQQAELEALKAEIVSIEKNTDYWADKANWIKPNEPVAWMREENDSISLSISEETGNNWIPLYTNPIELTDEEMYKVWFNYGCGMPWTANTKTFIRAILRKASEK